jgi:hypothetical protein
MRNKYFASITFQTVNFVAIILVALLLSVLVIRAQDGSNVRSASF